MIANYDIREYDLLVRWADQPDHTQVFTNEAAHHVAGKLEAWVPKGHTVKVVRHKARRVWRQLVVSKRRHLDLTGEFWRCGTCRHTMHESEWGIASGYKGKCWDCQHPGAHECGHTGCTNTVPYADESNCYTHTAW